MALELVSKVGIARESLRALIPSRSTASGTGGAVRGRILERSRVLLLSTSSGDAGHGSLPMADMRVTSVLTFRAGLELPRRLFLVSSCLLKADLVIRVVSSEGKISSSESSEVKSSGLGIIVEEEIACSLGLVADTEL